MTGQPNRSRTPVAPSAPAPATAPRQPARVVPGRPPASPPARPACARPPASQPAPAAAEPVLDMRRYVPAYLTGIANKLSRGASQHYLDAFGVGIETWRLLVLLAVERSVPAQHACRVIGMDKASVSRAFKAMRARGLITVGLDAADGRLRVATITPAGRALHDRIRGLALERERALLEVLAPHERELLLGLLHRLHENLPAVEAATERYLQRHGPHAPAGTCTPAAPPRGAPGHDAQDPDPS